MYAMCDDVRNGEYITWEMLVYTPCKIFLGVKVLFPRRMSSLAHFLTLNSKHRQPSFTRLPQDVRLEDGSDPGQLRRVAQQLLQPGLEGGGGEEREAQQQLLRVNMGEISE